MTDSDVDVIHEVSDAVAKGDPAAIAGRLHKDIVWEHNIGVGSPDEGVYRGRESVIALFERIVEEVLDGEMVKGTMNTGEISLS